MTLTLDILRQWFWQFNREYFGGELPEPRLRLSRARTRLGSMSYKRGRLTGMPTDFAIGISTCYQLTQKECREVLIHEMIHYYIAYRRIADTSSHGRVFRGIMQYINNKYGWNVTVSCRLSSLQPSESLCAAFGGGGARCYIVLALELNDGRCMLSVVSPGSVARLDATLRGLGTVASHAWYVTDDDFFFNYPKVRSLRAVTVDRNVYEAKTAAMTPLSVKP